MIPETVLIIRSKAFEGCTNLTNVEISEGMSCTCIEFGAFYGCSNLTSIVIPESLTTIEEKVFYGCSKLKSIYLPPNITTISNGTFDQCSAVRYTSIGTDTAKALGKAGYSFRVVEGEFDLRYDYSGGETYTLSLLAARQNLAKIAIPMKLI